MSNVDFTKLQGLVPAIVQDSINNQVLMVGFMNEKAFELTRKTKKAYFWSRTRKKLWMKGETSGDTLTVVEIVIDCDQDAVLLKVIMDGEATCHKGTRSCFSLV